MATVMNDLVEKVRSMLYGTQVDPLTLLAAPYAPGDPEISLASSVREVGAGSLVCVGLNTFYVLSVGSDATSMRVIPGADGGPDEPVAQGAIMRVKPRVTTWSIFRELHDAIADLASPLSGLYQPMSFEADFNMHGVYSVPQGWFDAAVQPQRFIRARYRSNPDQDWTPIFGAEWLVERYSVQVINQPQEARTFEFTFGFPFLTPTSLADEMFDLGLTERSTQNLPPLRAAERLSYAAEGMRVQSRAQGDSRRPGEVPPTSSSSLGREWGRSYEKAVQEERTRLQTLFGYTFPIGER